MLRRALTFVYGYAISSAALYCVLLPTYLWVAATFGNRMLGQRAPLAALLFALVYSLAQIAIRPLMGGLTQRNDRAYHQAWNQAKNAGPLRWLVFYLVACFVLLVIGLAHKSAYGFPTPATILAYSFGLPADIMFW